MSALLGRLASLQRLVLDGNQADDITLRHVAGLPHLRELSLRRSEHVTDGGLSYLARRRGSTALPRSGSLDAAGAPLGAAAGESAEARDVGLVSLDISGCSGLSDQFWLAIVEMQGLTSLHLEHMAPLLQFPSMPEQLPAALWRLPRLRRLSL